MGLDTKLSPEQWDTLQTICNAVSVTITLTVLVRLATASSVSISDGVSTFVSNAPSLPAPVVVLMVVVVVGCLVVGFVCQGFAKRLRHEKEAREARRLARDEKRLEIYHAAVLDQLRRLKR